MKFNEAQKELFQKNCKACLNKPLIKELKKIKKCSRFTLKFGNDSLDINIQDSKDKSLMYENALDELNSKLDVYQKKYPLYPVLYFYGFGNGILYKALLQNPNLKHCVVFEDELELIFLMFHIIDFSSEFESKKLLIFAPKLTKMNDYHAIFTSDPFCKMYKAYFLELHSHYYEKKSEKIIELNKTLVATQKQTAIEMGNDPLDALQGLAQQVYNLPAQLTHPTSKEFLQKRGKQVGKCALIVSTGPSLSKQLPLLKKYQDKVTIFCADSAYPILAQNDIKPDYVCMLERTDFTAEFFNHDFKEIDKNAIFVLLNLVHPNAVAYCEQYNRNYLLMPKKLHFCEYLHFTQFKHITGMSVAHMAQELAFGLEYTNIIFIGQDLAYADDGSSHPKDYQHSANFESSIYEDDMLANIPAWGGTKEVRTHHIWLAFKDIIERNIMMYKLKNTKIAFYNAIEGGARIEGCTEIPFKEVCEKFFQKQEPKHFEKLEPLSLTKQNELLLKAYAKIKKSIVLCEEMIKRFKEILEECIEEAKNIDTNKTYEENKLIFSTLSERIDEAKEIVEDKKHFISATEILFPLLNQFEINIAPLFVYNPQNETEKQQKMILWLDKHISWIRLVGSHLEAQVKALNENSKPLIGLLKQRGQIFEAKMKMIDEKAQKGKSCLMFY
ncbi:motility associated factor glycosyltransferase family protein [Campylobacter sp. MIT 19-121]|uniref:motility associated factor glycosyltransferase family protein n=1 Tax=Campylobacter sp. MIT 19-121 TaxID=2703906 RepID=UPI001389BD35|nr:motility associated factor glycosyltransferase family protein [Campylobacter sp. MIT 19-121]NDJ26743.1 motility associated factor glycosyltransferase family protein [Campylobacter sp. MIT 19-121]